MNTSSFKNIFNLFLLILILILIPGANTTAQEVEDHKPVNLVLVIDNSCSMFPRNRILPGCTSWGSDPEFLRFVGADLFLARLGFAESNEADYQVSVIDLGDVPILISPLVQLEDARDELAKQISAMTARSATRFVPALELAYQELLSPDNPKPDNLPVIVLITDGIPWPQIGQSNIEIENLIKKYPNVPLFMMLLQGEEPSEDYLEYIDFWEDMRKIYNHVFVYPIAKTSQIETTYNNIVSSLHDTIPSSPVQATPDESLQIFINEYTKQVIITIAHSIGEEKAEIEIIDPDGVVVSDSDPGVSHFRGTENPIEVISIQSPRLTEELGGKHWILKSSKEVRVFIDREGSYKFNFQQPKFVPSNLPNYLVAVDRHPSRDIFKLSFDLVTSGGKVIKEVQSIRGEVILPNGNRMILPISSYTKPDPDGIYEISFDFPTLYHEILNQPGRFTFKLNAGFADSLTSDKIPVTSINLQVDVGPGPYIIDTNPKSLQCSTNIDQQFSVKIGSYNTFIPESVEVSLHSTTGTTRLNHESEGFFTGSIRDLCLPIIQQTECSTQIGTSFLLQISGQHIEGFNIPVIELEVPLIVYGESCTPPPALPTTTPKPTPSPTYTPVPDSDIDGINNLEDVCPDRKGYLLFEGCPPPMWLVILVIVLGVGIPAFMYLYGWGWIKVRSFAKPPTAFLTACRDNRMIIDVLELHELGRKLRLSELIVGSNPSASQITIKGLNPTEFIISSEGDTVLVKDAERKSIIAKGDYRKLAPIRIPTSNPKITLLIGFNVNIRNRMHCGDREKS